VRALEWTPLRNKSNSRKFCKLEQGKSG